MHLKYYHLQSKLNLYVSAHTVHCYRWQIHNYFNIQIVIYMCKAASKDWTQYNNISERDEFVIYCSIVEFSFNVLFERGLSVFSCTILGFFFVESVVMLNIRLNALTLLGEKHFFYYVWLWATLPLHLPDQLMIQNLQLLNLRVMSLYIWYKYFRIVPLGRTLRSNLNTSTQTHAHT